MMSTFKNLIKLKVKYRNSIKIKKGEVKLNITKGMRINQKIRQRVLDTANYILKTKSTVRQAAEKLNTSKSTVHMDVSVRLKLVDPVLYKKVRKHLDYNFSIKHLNGGQATKMKYEQKSSKA